MSESEIEKYIPQRSPFLFVDQIVEAGEDSVVTSFYVKEEHILCESGFLQEAGMIENIAQSAAAMEGYAAVHRHEAVKLGFIGAVKNLKINGRILVGSILTTTVHAVNEVMGVKIIEGIIRVEDRLIAQCTLQIFLKND